MSRNLRCRPIVLTALSILLLCTRFGLAEFRAGAATVDVTPQTFPVIVVGSMLSRTATEVHTPLLAKAIFENHPVAEGCRDVFRLAHPDGGSPHLPHIEGGDVLIPSDEVILVGISERTDLWGAEALARRSDDGLVAEAQSVRDAIDRLLDSRIDMVFQMQARIVPVPSEIQLNDRILEAGGIHGLRARLAQLTTELDLRGLA